MTQFQKWLTKFVEEKQLDLSEPVEGKKVSGKITQLQVGDVLSAMMSAPASEQAQIKKILVQIDFANGDVMHFIRHAAKALDSSHKLGA